MATQISWSRVLLLLRLFPLRLARIVSSFIESTLRERLLYIVLRSGKLPREPASDVAAAPDTATRDSPDIGGSGSTIARDPEAVNTKTQPTFLFNVLKLKT